MSLEKLKFIHHIYTFYLISPCFLALFYCYCNPLDSDTTVTRRFRRNLIGPILPVLIGLLYNKYTYFIVKGKIKILITSFWVRGIAGTMKRVLYTLEADGLLLLIFLIGLFVIYFCWVLCKLDRRWYFVFVVLNIPFVSLIILYGF